MDTRSFDDNKKAFFELRSQYQRNTHSEIPLNNDKVVKFLLSFGGKEFEEVISKEILSALLEQYIQLFPLICSSSPTQEAQLAPLTSWNLTDNEKVLLLNSISDMLFDDRLFKIHTDEGFVITRKHIIALTNVMKSMVALEKEQHIADPDELIKNLRIMRNTFERSYLFRKDGRYLRGFLLGVFATILVAISVAIFASLFPIILPIFTASILFATLYTIGSVGLALPPLIAAIVAFLNIRSEVKANYEKPYQTASRELATIGTKLAKNHAKFYQCKENRKTLIQEQASMPISQLANR